LALAHLFIKVLRSEDCEAAFSVFRVKLPVIESSTSTVNLRLQVLL